MISTACVENIVVKRMARREKEETLEDDRSMHTRATAPACVDPRLLRNTTLSQLQTLSSSTYTPSTRMSTHERPLVGSVVERTTPRTSSVPSPRFTGTPGTGFPTAQHRFKSAFARARDEANSKGNVGGSRRIGMPSIVSNKPQTHPPVAPTSPVIDPKPIPTDADALRRQIHEENARAIARMSEADIEQEKRAVLEQLGDGTEQLLRRVQEARRRKEAKEKEAQAELEEQGAQETQGKVEGTINDDDPRRTTEHDRDHEHVALVASPTPRRVPHGLATKPGVLRVKSLENIGQSGRIHPVL